MLILSPSYFAFILLNCPPRLFFCLTEQCTVAFRSKFILPSGWVCACLETELCLWVLPPWNTGQCAGVIHQIPDKNGQWEPDFFLLFQAKPFLSYYFILLWNLEEIVNPEFSAVFMWMYVTFPSLLVRMLWPKVLRYTSFQRLFSLLNFKNRFLPPFHPTPALYPTGIWLSCTRNRCLLTSCS